MSLLQLYAEQLKRLTNENLKLTTLTINLQAFNCMVLMILMISYGTIILWTVGKRAPIDVDEYLNKVGLWVLNAYIDIQNATGLQVGV